MQIEGLLRDITAVESVSGPDVCDERRKIPRKQQKNRGSPRLLPMRILFISNTSSLLRSRHLPISLSSIVRLQK